MVYDSAFPLLASFFLVLFACSVNKEVVVCLSSCFLFCFLDYEKMVSLQFQSFFV